MKRSDTHRKKKTGLIVGGGVIPGSCSGLWRLFSLPASTRKKKVQSKPVKKRSNNL